MKPGVLFKTICVLLVLVMASTVVVCPTFAKYATNGEATDDARVAKWGVTVTMADNLNGTKNNLFTRYYKSGDYETSSGVKTAQNQASEWQSGASVKGAVDVVAPGTWGYMNYIKYSGTPETDVEIGFNLDLALENWVANGEEYCPMIFKVCYGSAMTDVNGKDLPSYKYIQMDDTIDTVEKLEKAVEDAVNCISTKHDANTDLSALSTSGHSLRVFWAWPFNSENPGLDNTNQFKNVGVGDAVDPGITDGVKDTYLCDLAADENAENDATIDFTISCTISQVD